MTTLLLIAGILGLGAAAARENFRRRKATQRANECAAAVEQWRIAYGHVCAMHVSETQRADTAEHHLSESDQRNTDLENEITAERAAHDLTRAERDKAQGELAGGIVMPLYEPATDVCLPPLHSDRALVDIDEGSPIFDQLAGASA